MVGIYKITSPSGKVYIGQSIDLQRRIVNYNTLSTSRNSVKLHNSFKKYGTIEHVFEIVEECDTNMLNDRERHWQDHYNAVESGLNCRYTQSTDKAGKISQESRDKMSVAKKGKDTWTKGILRQDINRGKSFYAKPVLNTETGVVYECAKDAAESCTVKYKTLIGYLNGRMPNKTPFVWA